MGCYRCSGRRIVGNRDFHIHATLSNVRFLGASGDRQTAERA